MLLWKKFWAIDMFSSFFFPSRFDYEGLDPRAAFYLMRDLEAVITDKAFTSQKFAVGDHVYGVEKAENFEYIDPVDGSVTRNQVSCSHDRKWRIAVRADSVCGWKCRGVHQHRYLILILGFALQKIRILPVNLEYKNRRPTLISIRPRYEASEMIFNGATVASPTHFLVPRASCFAFFFFFADVASD